MGRLPDNYIGPKERITRLKTEHPGQTSSIRTSVQMLPVGDALCVLVKADVYLGETLVASGHAFTDEPEEDKAVEKAETIAIGRALVNAGYPETGDDEGEAEEAPAKPRNTGGLGVVPKKTESEPAKPKASGLGGKLGASKPKVVEKEAEEETTTEEAAEAEVVDEVPADAKPASEPPAVKKLTREELLAKYKPKKEA